jgi:DNA-binding PadR family transcriptional regulator
MNGKRSIPDVTAGAKAVSVADNRPRILQHFEHAVLLGVLHLGPRAFPAEIARHLTMTLERRVALAQAFTALERLEDRGFVSSQEMAPEPVRGGRRRRLFRVEASGEHALRVTAATLDRMASREGKAVDGSEVLPAAT